MSIKITKWLWIITIQAGNYSESLEIEDWEQLGQSDITELVYAKRI